MSYLQLSINCFIIINKLFSRILCSGFPSKMLSPLIFAVDPDFRSKRILKSCPKYFV